MCVLADRAVEICELSGEMIDACNIPCGLLCESEIPDHMRCREAPAHISTVLCLDEM